MAHASQPHQSANKFQFAERIVYDKDNGEIVHVHQVVWRPDRTPPTASFIDADALRVAAKVRKRTEIELDVLSIAETLEPNFAYTVDLRTKALVKKPAEAMGPLMRHRMAPNG
jgi:hypothetical protein